MAYLALTQRAYAFLADRGSATERELVAHVFGGVAPLAVREAVLGPLRNDPRVRCAKGVWHLAGVADVGVSGLSVACLAVATTGPRPSRHRVLSLAIRHLDSSGVFAATLNPSARVPGYAGQRARVGHDEDLNALPTFGEIVDELVSFVGQRPVCAQEVALTWEYLEQEARRVGRTLPRPTLLDVNDLADLVLDMPGKPSLPLIAEHLGIGVVHAGQPRDDARVLSQLVPELLQRADGAGLRTLTALEAALSRPAELVPPLRQAASAQALPDSPGVYRLRDAHEDVLYVGKARRLRTRLQAYVHRPLGATRRLEGLAERVSAIDTTVCGSDLEALVLEGREIRRLQPRFNTQRRSGGPRLWLSLPPEPAPRPGKRQLAPRRLHLAERPTPDGQHLGPFRNQAIATSALRLARDAYGLDALRGHHGSAYAERLGAAFGFLGGDPAAHADVVEGVRGRLAAARASRSHADAWRLERLLKRVLAYDPRELILPADPAAARFAVVRPTPEAEGRVEVFVLDRAILVGQIVVWPGDVVALDETLRSANARTEPADREVVLRWMGAQRPPARLVHLPDEPDAALAALLDASSAGAPADA